MLTDAGPMSQANDVFTAAVEEHPDNEEKKIEDGDYDNGHDEDGESDSDHGRSPYRSGESEERSEEEESFEEEEWEEDDEEWEEEGATDDEEESEETCSDDDEGRPVGDDFDRALSSAAGAVPLAKIRLLLFKLGHCLSVEECSDMLDSIDEDSCQSQMERCRELHRSCLSIAKDFEPLPLFIFVNPSSGGNMAARWLSLPARMHIHGLSLSSSVEAWTGSLRKTSEHEGSEVLVEMRIFAMTEGASGKSIGFHQLAEAVSQNSSHVRVIVCGGDGTVSWVVTEMLKHKINLDHVALGVSAYGTGNDFSRVLGWGPVAALQYPAEDIDRLRTLVGDWIQAQLSPMDVWLASVSTKPGGSFALPKPNGTFGLTEKDKERLDIHEANGVKTCRKLFLNYFSLGALSQVGSTMEQHRSKSRLMNMYRYAKFGLSKAASSKHTLEIDRITDHMREGEEHILSAEACQQSGEKIVSLCFLNIPSIMGGSDVWGRSSSTAGKGGARFLDWVQDMGDHCIELLTFSSFKDIVCEKMGPVFHGNAKRLHGGRGPFHLKFKEQNNPDYERAMRKTEGRLHFQADGEFMAVSMPDSLKVQRCRTIMVMLAQRGKHDDVLSEVLDDGARLLHFIKFLDSRGNTHAAESAYVAAMVRGSAASHGVVEVLHHIVEELLHNESLMAYLEDLSRRRRTTTDLTPEAEDESPSLVCHEVLGQHVNKEHEMFTFATCVNHGVRLAVETQGTILEVLGCDSGDPLSSALRDTHLTSVECVQRWCGPAVEAEQLQVDCVRSFDVPRLGHIWVEPCEVPFIFDDAAPETFQRLRAMAGIREHDYVNSICRQDSDMITFGTNSRSGESFFFSHDGLFMIKTISDAQASKLLEMLCAYEAHLRSQPRSLLVRFLGMFRIRTAKGGPAITCSGRWCVVMASTFYTSLGMHEKYDLKGSTSSNRRSKPGDFERGLALKDLDWRDRATRSGPLQLSVEDATWLLEQHSSDTAFLESFGLFDYSVLLGVHDTSKATDGQTGVGATRKSGGRVSFVTGLAAAKFLKNTAGRKSKSSAEDLSLVESQADAPVSPEATVAAGGSGSESEELCMERPDSGSNEDTDSCRCSPKVEHSDWEDSAVGDSTLPWQTLERVENLTPKGSCRRVGEAIVSEDGNQLYFIGIIDILEPFDTHRAAEEFLLRGLAQVSGWAAGHSLVNPKKYRKRQMDFLRKVCPDIKKPKASRTSRMRSSVQSGIGSLRRRASFKLPI